MNPIYILTNRKVNSHAKCTWDLFHDDKFIDSVRMGSELTCVRIDNPSENSPYEYMSSDKAFDEMQKIMMSKRRDAIYYGHGFNNDFEDVIKGYFDLQK